MPGFEVTPEELVGAASTLGAVDATLNCPTVGSGDLGSPELEAAVDRFNAEAGKFAPVMFEAISVAGANAAAAAYAYVVTDTTSMPGGR